MATEPESNLPPEVPRGEDEAEEVIAEEVEAEAEEVEEVIAEIEEVEPEVEEVEAEEVEAEKIKAPKSDPDAYLQSDEAPPIESKSKFCKWHLVHGTSEQALIDDYGQDFNSVRIFAQNLEKANVRDRPRDKNGKILMEKPGAKPSAEKKVQVFAKGSPPEALINAMTMPISGVQGFEDGMKFGASMIVLGVRIAQELSTIGIQQAKPLLDMAKDMRSGEALAAKSASYEAAAMAAAEVHKDLAPDLAAIAAQAGSSGDNPMMGMFARSIEPLFKNVMSKMMTGPLMGGMGGPPQQQIEEGGMNDQSDNWPRRKE